MNASEQLRTRIATAKQEIADLLAERHALEADIARLRNEIRDQASSKDKSG